MSGLDNGPAVLFFKIFGYSFYCFFFLDDGKWPTSFSFPMWFGWEFFLERQW
jgi:hypothetical protein